MSVMTTLPARSAMLRAFLDGDPAAEGIFVVAVRTTGIFCRPTCPARKPKPENVEFHPGPAEALRAGFRPCKRCRPMDASGRPPEPVERLRRAIEADPDGHLADKDLVAMGIDPSTARRQFRRHFGMTFQAYGRARRMGLALKDVRAGRGLVEVGLDLGYDSPSAFREAFARAFGVAPSVARVSGPACLSARRLETPLGPMLALAGDDGLHLLDFFDRRGLPRKLASIRDRGTAVVPGDHPHLDAAATALDAYFAGRALAFAPDVPIVPDGSPWQRLAWDYLRTIPPGETRSYAARAEALGRPGASRAVGNANGLNFLSIAIPCHRVIRSDGTLCGYGGGLWRKQWLLDHERRALGRGEPSLFDQSPGDGGAGAGAGAEDAPRSPGGLAPQPSLSRRVR